MCVPIEHPLIQPERVRVPEVEFLPHDPVASLRASVLARRRGGVNAEQEVDVRIGRHRGELLARRPRVPECAWHQQNTAFTRLTADTADTADTSDISVYSDERARLSLSWV